MRVDETVQQAEALVRFVQEVDRRLAEFGVNGAAELVSLYRQLADALARIELAEIDWALREVASLVDRLRTLEGELGHLVALKAAFEVRH